MKKSIFLSISLLIAVAFTFNSCNKYDEGSNFSFLTAKSRLVNNWKLEKATYTYGGFSTVVTSDITTDVKKDGNYSTVYTSGGSSLTETGVWTFNSDKTQVTFAPTTSGSTPETFDIIKLKKNELSLQQVDGGTTVRMDYVTK